MLSSSPVALSRRRFLAVSSGVVGLAVATGCAVPTADDSPDPILELIRAAERDAREFAAADASHGKYADALRRLAEVRRIHAERLGELVDDPAASGTAATTPPPGAAASCPPIAEVRTRLRGDADQAAGVAVAADGARAELTGSVSAACTAAVEVELS